MSGRVDPEGHEQRALHELVDFTCTDVLEIGCGDGRMLWRYSEKATSVLGLDPVESDIRLAQVGTPESLRSRVQFRVADARSVDLDEAMFDVVVLGRSI
jgi:ubiquinone/menaquinone biosynthesis C-methylase UbiE